MYRRFLKRIFDFLLALLIIVIGWPVFALIALLIRVKIGKRVIFAQLRPGRDEKLFTIYKFRTMTDAKDASGQLLPDEQRLTKFGSRLRALSFDELPEIFNILKGDMSFIGPRPLLVKDYIFFDDAIRARQKIRPGLSGWAQVCGRNNASWEQKFIRDAEYLAKYSFAMDAKIFFMTFFKSFVTMENINTDGMATAENYGDYLLRIGAITKERYDERIAKSEELISEFVEKRRHR